GSRTSAGCDPHRRSATFRKEPSMTDATPTTQLPAAMRPQPFARWNPTRGVWETSQPDLSGRLAPWPLIEDIFTAGDATPMPSHDGSTTPDGPPQHRHS